MSDTAISAVSSDAAGSKNAPGTMSIKPSAPAGSIITPKAGGGYSITLPSTVESRKQEAVRSGGGSAIIITPIGTMGTRGESKVIDVTKSFEEGQVLYQGPINIPRGGQVTAVAKTASGLDITYSQPGGNILPTQQSTNIAGDIVNRNLPQLNYSDQVRFGQMILEDQKQQKQFESDLMKNYSPSSQTVPRTINPSETFTTGQGSRIMFAPTTSAIQSVSASNKAIIQGVVSRANERMTQQELTELTLKKMDTRILPFFESNINKGTELINAYYFNEQNIPQDKTSIYRTATFLPKAGIYTVQSGLGALELGYFGLTRPKETSTAIGVGALAFGGALASDVRSLRGEYGYLPATTGFVLSQAEKIKRNPGSLFVDLILVSKIERVSKPITIPIKNQYLIQKAKFADDFIPLSEITFGGGAYKGINPIDDFSDFSKGGKVNAALKKLEGETVAFSHVTAQEFPFKNGMIQVQRSVPKTPEPIITSKNLGPLGTFTVENLGMDEAQLMQLGGVNTRRALMEEVNFYNAVQKFAPLTSETTVKKLPVTNFFGDESLLKNFKVTNVLKPGEAQAYTRYAVGDESYGYKFSLTPNKPSIYYGVGEVGFTKKLSSEKATSEFLNTFGEGGLLYVSPENVFGVSREFQLVALAEKTNINLKSRNPDILLNPEIMKNTLPIQYGRDDSLSLTKGFIDTIKARETPILPEDKYSLIASEIKNPFTLKLQSNPSGLTSPFLKLGEKIFEKTMPKQEVVKVGVNEIFYTPVEVEATIKDVVTGKTFTVSSKEFASLDTKGVKGLLESKTSGKELMKTNELIPYESRSTFKAPKVLSVEEFKSSSSASKRVGPSLFFPLSSLQSSREQYYSSSSSKGLTPSYSFSSSSKSSSIIPSSSSSKTSSSTSLISSSSGSSSKSSGSSSISSSSSSSSIISSFSSSSSRSSSSSSSRSISRIIKEPKPLFFPSAQEQPRKKEKQKKFKSKPFKGLYTPSVEAAFFDIKGSKPGKRELSMGLNIRPILNKRSK